MQYINEQLKYGYNEDQLKEMIHSVAGYGADTVTEDRYNRFIGKKIAARKILWIAIIIIIVILSIYRIKCQDWNSETLYSSLKFIIMGNQYYSDLTKYAGIEIMQ